MDESPEELISEWLRFEKEHAELGDNARQILELAGIEDISRYEALIWLEGTFFDGVFYPYIEEDRSIVVTAYCEYTKVCREQSRIERPMKEIRMAAIRLRLSLPELTQMKLPAEDGSLRRQAAYEESRAAEIGWKQWQVYGGRPDSEPVHPMPFTAANLTPEQKANKPREALQKAKDATAVESVIISAINDGLRRPEFCKHLDWGKVPPRVS